MWQQVAMHACMRAQQSRHDCSLSEACSSVALAAPECSTGCQQPLLGVLLSVCRGAGSIAAACCGWRGRTGLGLPHLHRETHTVLSTPQPVVATPTSDVCSQIISSMCVYMVKGIYTIPTDRIPASTSTQSDMVLVAIMHRIGCATRRTHHMCEGIAKFCQHLCSLSSLRSWHTWHTDACCHYHMLLLATGRTCCR